MSIIKEVADGIDLIASSISNIKTIVNTVKDGKGYLENRYKEAKSDVVQMLDEMGKTMITMSKVSSILTHFSFINDPAHYGADLQEFRNLMMNSKSELQTLEQNIENYRGHCSVIRNHADKIKDGNKLDYLFMIFGIDSKEKNEELGNRLRMIYDDERNQYMAVDILCNNLKRAIEDVYNTLGGPGMIDPAKVPEAAALLRDYSEVFTRLEEDALQNYKEIRQLTQELS